MYEAGADHKSHGTVSHGHTGQEASERESISDSSLVNVSATIAKMMTQKLSVRGLLASLVEQDMEYTAGSRWRCFRRCCRHDCPVCTACMSSQGYTAYTMPYSKL